MYYVIQVAPGKEKETECMIAKMIDGSLYESCFHLTRDMRKKYRGQWKTITQKLLPGYVFMKSDDISRLYTSVYSVPMLTKFLGREENFFTALNQAEEMWVEKLVSGGSHVPVSQVDITEGDKVIALSAPLTELEGYVKRIDRHKKIAVLEVEFLGEKREFFLGIDMVKRAD